MNSVKRNLQIHNIILNYYLLSIEPSIQKTVYP